MPHSFSVEEIQKGRSLLKSSKSYPEDFLKKQNGSDLATMEDGDNSSSGVSSDQEVPTVSSIEYSDRLSHEHSSMTLPSPKTQRTQTGKLSFFIDVIVKRTVLGMLSRHAVSLARLPPPIETENDEKEEFCLPPPPEFGENTSNAETTEAVLAPPPQFSDSRQVTRVRIVGAVPKGSPGVLQPKLKQGRLHSQ